MHHYAPNDGRHIDDIMLGTTCNKHNAIEGVPCWYVYSGVVDGSSSAICGARVKRFGFDGQISRQSTNRSSGASR